MKYPKTPHLIGSRSIQEDDIFGVDDSIFNGKKVVITEKMDGENFCMSNSGCHARSESGNSKPWQSYVRGVWSKFSYRIPVDMDIFGENMFASHSIQYFDLPSYILVFGVVRKEKFLPWDEVERISGEYGLATVPVIYKGIYKSGMVDEIIKGKKESAFSGVDIVTKDKAIEGVVIRLYEEFSVDEFAKSVAKFVRKDHIKTDKRWESSYQKNQLRL